MRLTDEVKTVIKEPPSTAGFTTTSMGVNMANYARCKITLITDCSDAAVVGGAVTLFQGTSATCETALPFTEYWKNEDMEAGDTLTKVTATTLASAGVRNKLAMYVFEVKADQLDTDTFGSENTYIRLNMTAITTATGTSVLMYQLYEPRYVRGAENLPSGF